MLRSLRQGRWLPWVAGTTLLLLVAVVAAVSSVRGGDVFNEDVPFRLRPPPAPLETPAAGRRGRQFSWAFYGYDKSRTRYLPARRDLGPPYRLRWAFRNTVLLEFPPALGGRSAFLLRNNASLYAISRRTGRRRWKRHLGSLSASAPAYAYKKVFVTILKRFRTSKGGRVVAVRARNGSTRWSRKLPSRSESSPIVHRGKLFFGTEDGTVYALRTRDGAVVWRYRADGAVKGGPTLDERRRRLYFGDYAGAVHALRVADGRRVWRAKVSSGPLGLGRGAFYSTPAVAYGRVYIGNTNGGVYSFDEDTGRLAWRKHTGAYVYSSPAVAHVPRGRPTVYVGSYDGRLYALDARTGRPRWSLEAEGRISGSPVVVGGLVWYSTLARTTAAVGARTGRRVYLTHRGAFNPVVSDGRAIFLVGYSSLFALEPERYLPEERDGATGRPAAPLPPALSGPPRARVAVPSPPSPLLPSPPPASLPRPNPFAFDDPQGIPDAARWAFPALSAVTRAPVSPPP
jgi:outer membrane protein assembly factor BamB